MLDDARVFLDLPSTTRFIPAAAPHLPLLSVGGIGVCGRNTRHDGLCQLLPPLSCYTCSLFGAFCEADRTAKCWQRLMPIWMHAA